MASVPYVITISRQFASLGRTIGQKMAADLGIMLYDRDIVAETASRMGISIKDVSDNEESATGEKSKRSFLMRNRLFNFHHYDISDEIFEVQQNIIRDFAARESCIIVGRCAETVLSGRPNLLSVYIYAPIQERFNNCVNELMMDEDTAMDSIKRVDAARESYRRRYAPDAKSILDNHHLMVDSSRLGPDMTAKMLVQAVRTIFELK